MTYSGYFTWVSANAKRRGQVETALFILRESASGGCVIDETRLGSHPTNET